MSEWSPWRKWWMDVSKHLIGFTLVWLVGYLLINTLEYERDQARARESARAAEASRQQAEARRELRVSSLRYVESAHDAIVALRHLFARSEKGATRSDAMARYEGIADEDFLLAAESVRVSLRITDESPSAEAWRKVESQLVSFEAARTSLHDLYDRAFNVKDTGDIVFAFDPREAAREAEFKAKVEALRMQRSELIVAMDSFAPGDHAIR